MRLDAHMYGPITKWRHWGMFMHWGNKLRIRPNAVRVEMPPALSSYSGADTSACPRVWLGPIGVLCKALEARKNSVGRVRRKRIIWKSENGVTATTTLIPHANSRLHLGTLSHLASWNKPIHGLELFQFTTVSPVSPTCANTFDRSRHFESGTFLNPLKF